MLVRSLEPLFRAFCRRRAAYAARRELQGLSPSRSAGLPAACRRKRCAVRGGLAFSTPPGHYPHAEPGVYQPPRGRINPIACCCACASYHRQGFARWSMLSPPGPHGEFAVSAGLAKAPAPPASASATSYTFWNSRADGGPGYRPEPAHPARGFRSEFTRSTKLIVPSANALPTRARPIKKNRGGGGGGGERGGLKGGRPLCGGEVWSGAGFAAVRLLRFVWGATRDDRGDGLMHYRP